MYAIGNYDAGRLTGYLQGETPGQARLFHTLKEAEDKARSMNLMPHAAGRVYAPVAAEGM